MRADWSQGRRGGGAGGGGGAGRGRGGGGARHGPLRAGVTGGRRSRHGRVLREPTGGPAGGRSRRGRWRGGSTRPYLSELREVGRQWEGWRRGRWGGRFNAAGFVRDASGGAGCGKGRVGGVW